TETVYGLAAHLTSESAIKKIFEIKNRPASNPLIIHIQNQAECIKYLTEIPIDFKVLTDAFWPGPLTLVMPIKEELIPAIARANLATAGFRVPCHPIAQQLLAKISPLVAPSANLSGKPSATRSDHVEKDFGIDFPLLDGGACSHGVESTILIYQEKRWYLARKGAISKEALDYLLGYDVEAITVTTKPVCPGQLFRHYAPKASLTLSKTPSHKIIVGFSDRIYEGAVRVFSLGRSSHPEEIAFNLYDVLRSLDAEGVEEAEVDINLPTTEYGLWITILERLQKAANG
ncbi:MAG: Sua5/YciO/YrdC/YwlC family protein, partial [Chlamydiia bacterium]|nr:Sua5/YciO/YrdC/YwlC family protein [Chlamydiia bacterium]